MNEIVAHDAVLRPEVTDKKIRQQDSAEHKVQPSFFETSLLIIMFAAVFFGWMIKEEEIMTAESGWGYALGITGGTLMLILILYPMRKHAKFMRSWGPVQYWFRAHMLLGIVGPVVILYHANFGLGSFNSNVALFSMLMVACSGLVGRFIYRKVHLGLYGRKQSLKDLKSEIDKSKEQIDDLFSNKTRNILQPLLMFEGRFEWVANNAFFGVFLLPVLPLHAKVVRYSFQRRVDRYINSRKQENRLTEKQAVKTKKIFANYARKYVSSTTKVVEFVVYERIFSLWHMLHLPLFIIMVSTGLFHVYAVHLY